MNDERECAAEEPTLRMKIRWKFYRAKDFTYVKWHGFYWRMLHLTGLAGVYGRILCRLNLYRKFKLNGRCMWCGEKHQ